MKFITIALLALIAVSVNADLASCIQGLPNPCGSNADASCMTALSQFNTCLTTNSCAQNVNNLSDYSKCVKGCAPSSNTDVQNYVNKYADCLSGSIIAYSFVFLAILTFMF
ncbi:transmembrane protein, putative (macronuclear) [Tetrahymena thermophila SB210]|uniref:Transmembrane protein, putative n=1 Tax=Tetrahymena thermophila (strain SB210) TaxID=312017 RepID=Q22L46_TETTS|nr:transmembrane protein, putative [Tetrahymena thermophila SB210]EAR85971.1 transmembrane protein, putative [Tetrahymena thermophila SB210]|eukprot:XP_976566.1 transmembrane protein, putative [Tetrahymena thermophila SB210]